MYTLCHSYIFRNCFNFCHSTTLSHRKRVLKHPINMTSNSGFVRSADFLPYAAASRNHHQGIIAFICGTIGLLFASPELLRPSHSWRSIITFISWIGEGFRQLSSQVPRPSCVPSELGNLTNNYLSETISKQ